MSSADNRANNRLPCKVTDVLFRAAGESESLPGKILNVSGSGVMLRVPSDPTEGRQITVDLDGGVIQGEVRYCRPNEDGSFDAGLRIIDFVKRT